MTVCAECWREITAEATGSLENRNVHVIIYNLFVFSIGIRPKPPPDVNCTYPHDDAGDVFNVYMAVAGLIYRFDRSDFVFNACLFQYYTHTPVGREVFVLLLLLLFFFAISEKKKVFARAFL